ncbi:hypothetical protein IG631_19748 [Alternaria alternata]|nr:hypothetical protein IG631_19748 [Alternaria alternata]
MGVTPKHSIIPPNNVRGKGPCPPGSHKRRRALQGQGDQLQSLAELAGGTDDAGAVQRGALVRCFGTSESRGTLVITGQSRG